MHDHSRFQRDIDDVTGVSLSLSLLLTKVTHAQYRKRFGASYNIVLLAREHSDTLTLTHIFQELSNKKKFKEQRPSMTKFNSSLKGVLPAWRTGLSGLMRRNETSGERPFIVLFQKQI